MSKPKEWFWCEDCKTYFQNRSKIKECLTFKHKLKKRTPVELRTVYIATGKRFFNIKVDNDLWTCEVDLAQFQKDKEGKWFQLGKCALDAPLTNMMRRINHLYPDNKVTTEQLERLFRTAILRGNYEERGKNYVKITLCFDTDLKLKPRNSESKLIYTTRSKLNQLRRSDEDVLEEAYEVAKRTPFRR